MLKETSFHPKRGWDKNPYMENAIPIFVMRSTEHILSPSYSLLNDYKSGKINWKEFSIRYIGEMQNERCKREMLKIKELANKKDVYLICACNNERKECHRFILMELINKIKEV